jgi:polyisoprenoid-binding protein YceI
MRNRLIAIALTAFFAAAGMAWAQENPCNPCGKAAKTAQNPCAKGEGNVFWVADPMKRNLVSFRSSAPLEDIVGTTNEVQGQLMFDPKQPDAGVRGEIRVPVAALSTGIKLRDEHLRSADWLDATKYPEIRYVIEGTRSVRLEKQGDGFSTWNVTLTGTLALHGQEKRVEVAAKVTYLDESDATRAKLPGNLLAGRAHFSLKLSEFGVKGFKGVVGSKVSDAIELDVSVMGSSVRPEQPGNPCNPCGKGAENPCSKKGTKTPDTPRK